MICSPSSASSSTAARGSPAAFGGLVVMGVRGLISTTSVNEASRQGVVTQQLTYCATQCCSHAVASCRPAAGPMHPLEL